MAMMKIGKAIKKNQNNSFLAEKIAQPFDPKFFKWQCPFFKGVSSDLHEGSQFYIHFSLFFKNIYIFL